MMHVKCKPNWVSAHLIFNSIFLYKILQIFHEHMKHTDHGEFKKESSSQKTMMLQYDYTSSKFNTVFIF